MQINNFIRFSESIKTRGDMRVVSVTVRPLIADCTGDIYFTDLQLQEGSRLTGYTPHTTTMLKNGEKRVTAYDEQLVRKLTPKITVFDDHLEFLFKSGIKIEIKG